VEEGDGILSRVMIFIVLILTIAVYSLKVEAFNFAGYQDGLIQTIGTHEIEGEIIDICPNMVVVNNSGVNFQFKLATQVKIFCNGYSACWQALKPIMSNSFFETRLVLNERNQVIIMDGFYRGEECLIQGWWENNRQLYLQLSPVDNEMVQLKCVTKNAILPKDRWLNVGQLVFVLYSRGDEVRGVYLPD
jgi:hypothetical protein